MTDRHTRTWRMLAVIAGMVASTSALAAGGDGLERLPADTRPIHYAISVTPDPARDTFAARGTLDFEVLQPTREVVLNADGLDVGSARIEGGVRARVRYDRVRQRVILGFAASLKKGTHRIALTWTGGISRNVEGLYKVDYPTPSGETKQMLFTHLCCIATARKFAPLWDQPDLKATFAIDLTTTGAVGAVSNMPVSRREALPGGRTRVSFAPTPKMSSYLLFFSVGEFDRITRQAGSTELGMMLQRGKAEKGRFALDASADALSYYNDYFGIPYPLPKLDSVVMPGAGNFGAMENWGAIFYFEPYIAIDPVFSTERDRQVVYEIVLHEVAHQWFGNLVTMRWWDDLWLNEGFASWMASKTENHFHPEWQPWLLAADSRGRAFQLDARKTTHPIVRQVHTLEEAELAFDEITYEKGSQVIRMLEAWVGEEAFRTAIRAHVRDHAYDNAVTADLWRALDAASDLPVTQIARDFTEQGGVPLIDVVSTHCAPGSGTTQVTLRQDRFGLDVPSRKPQLWHVPVTASVMGSGRITRQIVHGPAPAVMEVAGCGPVKVNVGETAYFRTRYDPASLAALKQRFAELPAADQLGLLDDSYGLAEGGYLPFADYLDLARRVGATSDPLVLLRKINNARSLDRLYTGLPGQTRFRAFVRAEFAPHLARIGWSARPGEPANTGVLRDALIELLSETDDTATIAEARRRFHGAAADPALLPGAVRKAVLMAVGAGADATVFTELADLAAKSRDSGERRLYLLALANANDPAIVARALELAPTDAVPAQIFTTLLVTIAERHPAQVFDFVTERFDALTPKFGSYERSGLVSMIAEKGADAALADRLAAFVAARIGAPGKESAARARSLILHRDEVRRTGLSQVDTWLAGVKTQ
ncbi:M1 family metallopeptidase [Sphingomonas sp.]|uniref:M1 family metallopeptidase n=1 Tax=Sphingomonas sp. TaxID=28214 RepID=UPI003D6D11B8